MDTIPRILVVDDDDAVREAYRKILAPPVGTDLISVGNRLFGGDPQVLGPRASAYKVVACIDGRGFRERREDMRQMLLRLNGKVFTMATLNQLIRHTRIREFVSKIF